MLYERVPLLEVKAYWGGVGFDKQAMGLGMARFDDVCIINPVALLSLSLQRGKTLECNFHGRTRESNYPISFLRLDHLRRS